MGRPVEVPKLPRLGTTWYERGTRYWLRRVRTAVFLLTVTAVCGAFAFGVYQGFTGSFPPAVRTAWNVTQAVASCAAVVWGWLKQRKDHRKTMLSPPTPAEALADKRVRSARAPGLSRAGLIPVLIAAPVLPMCFAWLVGWVAAWLTVREYPEEVGARRWVEEHPS
ncbi:hypothetical protein ABZ845_21580 [Streptomyces sp. NPDC047022]|uniref:hypothetical protein n=1 Tax=Streptomyces sp. NPDC047022 TaxID=3155737 RepID=UPI0033C02541